jgi:hypothetical protein
MQPLKKQKYFYYISFMLMASTFLPIVFNNLPPIIGSHHLWTIIWVISLIIYNPKIFLNKSMFYLVAYGLFLFLATKTILSNIDDWNNNKLFREFYQIFIGFSVITYFLQSKDYISLAKIAKWSILFLFITAIMSIISSIIDPMYARNLTGIMAFTNDSEREMVLSYKRYGGGTYSTAGAFMCLFPIFIYYFKNIKQNLISRNQIIIISSTIFLALLGMQIFGNILIAIIFCIIAILGTKRIKYTILVISLFFSIAVIIPKEIYVNTLLSVSDYFKINSELKNKFEDMALFVESGAKISDNDTQVGGRIARYPMLMKTFVKSPLLGCYFFSDESGNGYNTVGGHLYWMNKLTTVGIVGFIFFLIIPYNFIKNSLRYFSSTYKFYYILASLAILAYGLMKVIAGRETWYTFFIILPGLYYLPLLKRSNSENSFLHKTQTLSTKEDPVNW